MRKKPPNIYDWSAGSLAQVARTVGVDPERQLEWLLSFLNSDGAGNTEMINAHISFLVQSSETNVIPQDTWRPLTETEIRSLASELKIQLTNMLSGIGGSFNIETRGRLRHSIINGPAMVSWMLTAQGEYLDDLFKVRAFELISRHADALARCVECGNIFTRSRVDQMYCSTACSQKVRTRKFFAKKSKSGGRK